MNRKSFYKTFASLGWKIDERFERLPDCFNFHKQIGDTDMLWYCELADLPGGVSISTTVYRSSLRLNKIAQDIGLRAKGGGVPLTFMCDRVLVPHVISFQGDVSQAMKEQNSRVEAWVQSAPLEAFLEKAVVERPDGHGTRQALHVVALVEKGDWLTLSDYKDSFAKGEVLNFVSEGAEAMTFDILNRAFAAALDVAFPDDPPAPDKITPEAVTVLLPELKNKRRPKQAVPIEDPVEETQPPADSAMFRLGRAVARLWR